MAENLLSKVKIGSTVYDIKDATARAGVETNATAIATEKTRAQGVESGLDTRVSNLEARGRFLSNYVVSTGLPTTYPDIPSTATTTYTYSFKSGDYYIVGSVPASGTKYMPSGTSITATKSGDTWTWEVGKAETSDAISVGDQFVFDGTNWVHIAAAKDVTWGNIVGTLSNQTDLQSALDGKLSHKEGKTAAAGELAYKDSASATYVPAGTISQVDATPAGTVTVTLKDAAAASEATLTKADYTPAGAINVDGAAQAAGNKVLKGGSISVSVKDAAAATAVTDLTYESYTPAGTISAKASGGTAKVLTDAAFAKSNSSTTGAVQIEGSVSAPAMTVTAGSEKTFLTELTGGSVASFTEGAFTAAAIQEGFYTAGSDASLSAGAQASLTDQSTAKFVKKAFNFAMGTEEGETETLIISEVLNTDTNFFTDAVTDRGTFTANTLQTLSGGKATVIDTTKFSGGSKAADSFTPNVLQSANDGKVHDTPTVEAAAPTFTGEYYINSKTDDTVLKDVEFSGTAADVKLTGAKYLKQEIDAATFTGTEAALAFAGTKVDDALVSKVEYVKSAVDSATFAGTENKVTPTFSGTSATITVE